MVEYEVFLCAYEYFSSDFLFFSLYLSFFIFIFMLISVFFRRTMHIYLFVVTPH